MNVTDLHQADAVHRLSEAMPQPKALWKSKQLGVDGPVVIKENAQIRDTLIFNNVEKKTIPLIDLAC